MKAQIYKAVLLAACLAFLPAQEVTATERNIITQDDPVPYEVRTACEQWGQYYNICPELLEAVAYHESRFTADAKNGTCTGLMQINTSAHTKRLQALDVVDLNDISENVRVAADYLHELFEEYEDVGVVLGLYHGEQNAVANGERGKLSKYVRKILETSDDLERAHGK